MNKTIGIIGFGNMGSAIAERIKSAYKVIVFDKDKQKTKPLVEKSSSSGCHGTVPANAKNLLLEGNCPDQIITASKDIADLLKQSDVIILAVKPQDFDIILNEMKDCIKNKLIISIAAGITTSYMEKYLGKVRVIRAMPNIAAKIGEAETSLCRGRYTLGKDLDFAKELFDLIGKTWILKEEMIDAATAISGSGPAYIYYDMETNKYDPKNLPALIEQCYIERLEKAAEKVGFDAETALELAQSTTASSISLSAATGISPADLRKLVTSKGGTTEAALEVIINGGSWEEAALAAKKRAEELSKKE